MPTFSFGEGPLLLVVGKSPSDVEDRLGEPFRGALGKSVVTEVRRVWPGRVALANALRCRGVKPTPRTLQACRPYLTHDLAANPAAVLCVGTEAAEAVAGRPGKKPYSVHSLIDGHVWMHRPDADIPVFFAPWPSPWNRHAHALFLRVVERIDKWIRGTGHLALAPIGMRVNAIETPGDARTAMRELFGKEVSIDTETFGAIHDSEHMLLNLALATTTEVYAFDRRALAEPGVITELRRFLESPDLLWIGQNAKFDANHIRAALAIHIHTDPICDVGYWRKCFDPSAEIALEQIQPLVGMAGAKDVSVFVEKGAAALKKALQQPDALAPLIQAWKVTPDQLARALARVAAGIDPRRYSYAAIPDDLRQSYCARDAVSTARLHAWMRAHPDGNRVERIWTTVGLYLERAARQIEWGGMRVNRQNMTALRDHLSAEEGIAKAVLLPFAGTAFNINSSKQKAKLLFETLGLPRGRLTDGGDPSTSRDVLSELKHPVASALSTLSLIETHRRWADQVERHIRDTGLLYPGIRVAGTGTGRPSGSDPNMLNARRPEDALGVLVRNVIVAEPGWMLVEIDMAQIEVRVAAALSQDQKMLERLAAGVDIHLETAKSIAPALGIDPAILTKAHPLRSQAKTVIFSLLYRAHPDSLAGQLGVPKREARRLHHTIVGEYDGYERWCREQITFAYRNGYARTWWNGVELRRRPLRQIGEQDDKRRSGGERMAVNTPVQGTAADLTNRAIGECAGWLREAGFPGRLLLTVYDSGLFAVRKDVAADVVPELVAIFERQPLQGVAVLADVKLGKAWGSMHSLGG